MSGGADYYKYLYSNTRTESRVSDPFRDDASRNQSLLSVDDPFRSGVTSVRSKRSSFDYIAPSPLAAAFRSGASNHSNQSGQSSIRSRHEDRIPPPIWVQEREQELAKEQKWRKEVGEADRNRQEEIDRDEEQEPEYVWNDDEEAGPSRVPVVRIRDGPRLTHSAQPSMEELDMNFGGSAPVSAATSRINLGGSTCSSAAGSHVNLRTTLPTGGKKTSRIRVQEQRKRSRSVTNKSTRAASIHSGMGENHGDSESRGRSASMWHLHHWNFHGTKTPYKRSHSLGKLPEGVRGRQHSNWSNWSLRRKSSARSLSASSQGRRKSSACTNPVWYFRRPKIMTDDGLDIPFFSTELPPSVADEFMKEVKEGYEASFRVRHPWLLKKFFPFFWKVFTIFLVYILLVGYPLYPGAYYGLYIFFNDESKAIMLGCLIFLFWGSMTCFMPMVFTRFEPDITDEEVESRDASTTALIIPAYKAAGALPATIEHALHIFKPEQIFVIANGNNPTPLDETADVCAKYGVNHTWVPVGSKITAEFVGVALARHYDYILLIDDDVHIPRNLPLPLDRLQPNPNPKWWQKGLAQTACLGFTIRSTGENESLGTVWQQAQDLEYKLSGMTRTFAGKYGSATFPHGAIILWDRKVLMGLFGAHPGYAISEDWYFGHVARGMGHRITFCSQVFVPTETPTNFLWPDKGSGRGGYGEMTIWKQRFYRWNFFRVYRLWDNVSYLLFAWRLGRLEIVTKYCVFIEIYDSLSFIMRPIILPVAFATSWKLTLIMTAATIAMYVVGSLTFNAFSLGKKGARVPYSTFPWYFWMKFILNFINSGSMFYSWWMYGDYFNKKHPKVVENYLALEAAKKCIADKLGEDVKKELEAVTEKRVLPSLPPITLPAMPAVVTEGLDTLKRASVGGLQSVVNTIKSATNVSPIGTLKRNSVGSVVGSIRRGSASSARRGSASSARRKSSVSSIEKGVLRPRTNSDVCPVSEMPRTNSERGIAMSEKPRTGSMSGKQGPLVKQE